MSVARELRPLVVLRAAAAALVVGLLASLVLIVVLGVLLGDAGPDWDDPAGRAGLWLGVHAVVLGAAAGGAAVGTWQAAVAGAATRREAVLAGAGVPAALVVLAGLVADPSLAAITVGLAVAAGAALGALGLARRLG